MKYNKAGDIYFIQPGGKGSDTQRQFAYTAPAAGTLTVYVSNTGDNEDMTRMVTVKQDGKEQSQPGGTKTSAPQTIVTFEVEAGDLLIYPTGNSLRFYAIEYRSN